MAAQEPFVLSCAGGGVRTGFRIYLSDLMASGDAITGAANDPDATVTSDLAGVSATNIVTNSTDIEYGTSTYLPGQVVDFDGVATSSTEARRRGYFRLRIQTEAGDELAFDYPLVVYAGIPQED